MRLYSLGIHFLEIFTLQTYDVVFAIIKVMVVWIKVCIFVLKISVVDIFNIFFFPIFIGLVLFLFFTYVRGLFLGLHSLLSSPFL